MNVHTPERGANESRQAYAARRIESKGIASRMTLAGFGGGITSRQMLRNEQRKSGSMSKLAGSYGRGLKNKFDRDAAARSAARRAKAFLGS